MLKQKSSIRLMFLLSTMVLSFYCGLILLSNNVLASSDDDGDGLNNDIEIIIGTNPNKADTDNDGFDDSAELVLETSPTDANDKPASNNLITSICDYSGDGVLDANCVFGTDFDNDGLIDSVEITLGTNFNATDTDNDGFTDGAEVILDTNPLDLNDFPIDSDNDGLSDVFENLYGVTSASGDDDGDSLTNLEEQQYGTNPKSMDTDNDDISDNMEILLGSNPSDSTGICYFGGDASMFGNCIVGVDNYGANLEDIITTTEKCYFDDNKSAFGNCGFNENNATNKVIEPEAPVVPDILDFTDVCLFNNPDSEFGGCLFGDNSVPDEFEDLSGITEICYLDDTDSTLSNCVLGDEEPNNILEACIFGESMYGDCLIGGTPPDTEPCDYDDDNALYDEACEYIEIPPVEPDECYYEDGTATYDVGCNYGPPEPPEPPELPTEICYFGGNQSSFDNCLFAQAEIPDRPTEICYFGDGSSFDNCLIGEGSEPDKEDPGPTDPEFCDYDKDNANFDEDCVFDEAPILDFTDVCYFGNPDSDFDGCIFGNETVPDEFEDLSGVTEICYLDDTDSTLSNCVLGDEEPNNILEACIFGESMYGDCLIGGTPPDTEPCDYDDDNALYDEACEYIEIPPVEPDECYYEDGTATYDVGCNYGPPEPPEPPELPTEICYFGGNQSSFDNCLFAQAEIPDRPTEICYFGDGSSFDNCLIGEGSEPDKEDPGPITPEFCDYDKENANFDEDCVFDEAPILDFTDVCYFGNPDSDFDGCIFGNETVPDEFEDLSDITDICYLDDADSTLSNCVLGDEEPSNILEACIFGESMYGDCLIGGTPPDTEPCDYDDDNALYDEACEYIEEEPEPPEPPVLPTEICYFGGNQSSFDNCLFAPPAIPDRPTEICYFGDGSSFDHCLIGDENDPDKDIEGPEPEDPMPCDYDEDVSNYDGNCVYEEEEDPEDPEPPTEICHFGEDTFGNCLIGEEEEEPEEPEIPIEICHFGESEFGNCLFDGDIYEEPEDPENITEICYLDKTESVLNTCVLGDPEPTQICHFGQSEFDDCVFDTEPTLPRDPDFCDYDDTISTYDEYCLYDEEDEPEDPEDPEEPEDPDDVPETTVLTAVPVSETSILWRWQSKNTNSGYILYDAMTNAEKYRIGANAGTYLETSLNPNTTYYRYLKEKYKTAWYKTGNMIGVTKPSNSDVMSYNNVNKINTWYHNSSFKFISNNLSTKKIEKYRYVWDKNETTTLTDCNDPGNNWLTGIINLTATVGENYLHVVSCNTAEDTANEGVKTYGPYYYDDEKPVISMVKINQGEIYANTNKMEISVMAYDEGESSLDRMRIIEVLSTGITVEKFNNKYMSNVIVNLSTGDGNKLIFVEVWDKAGNKSIVTTAWDDIITAGNNPVGGVVHKNDLSTNMYDEIILDASAINMDNITALFNKAETNPANNLPYWSSASNYWWSDNKPYFSWGTISALTPEEEAARLEGFSIAMDGTPNDTVDTADKEYEYVMTTLSEGAHTLKIKAKSKAGAWSEVKEFIYKVDSLAPNLTVTYPTDKGTYGGDKGGTVTNTWQKITGKVADTTAGIQKVEIKIKRNEDSKYWDNDTNSFITTEAWNKIWSISDYVNQSCANNTAPKTEFNWEYAVDLSKLASTSEEKTYQIYVRTLDCSRTVIGGYNETNIGRMITIDRKVPVTPTINPVTNTKIQTTIRPIITAEPGATIYICLDQVTADGGNCNDVIVANKYKSHTTNSVGQYKFTEAVPISTYPNIKFYAIDSAGNMSTVTTVQYEYNATLTNITPTVAKTGNEIKLRGLNFGTTANKVKFANDIEVLVDQTDWTDTDITVTVPSNAVSGPIVVLPNHISISNAMNLTIIKAPTQVVLSPAGNQTLSVGETKVFAAYAKDDTGKVVPGVEFTWSIVNGVGTIPVGETGSVISYSSDTAGIGVLKVEIDGGVSATSIITVYSEVSTDNLQCAVPGSVRIDFSSFGTTGTPEGVDVAKNTGTLGLSNIKIYGSGEDTVKINDYIGKGTVVSKLLYSGDTDIKSIILSKNDTVKGDASIKYYVSSNCASDVTDINTCTWTLVKPGQSTNITVGKNIRWKAVLDGNSSLPELHWVSLKMSTSANAENTIDTEVGYTYAEANCASSLYQLGAVKKLESGAKEAVIKGNYTVEGDIYHYVDPGPIGIYDKETNPKLIKKYLGE